MTRRRLHDLVMVAAGTVVVQAALLTRTWGIHVDEILYAGYAIADPLGDALIVGNHVLIYIFNYGLFHAVGALVPSLAPLILPVVYAEAAVLTAWRLAAAMPIDSRRRRWAFALLLLSPFVVFNATQVMIESALIPLLSLALAAALMASGKGWSARRAVLLVLLAALCALTKATAMPALAVLTVALWPILHHRAWLLLAGGVAGTLVNRAALTLLHARSASYGGAGQLMASVMDLPLDRLLGSIGVWAFFAGVPSLAAAWCWRERRDRLSLALMALAWLSAPAAVIVQLSTDPALPFPRYAYPVIWVGLAAGSLASALSEVRWLAPLVLALQLPLATAIWPGVFRTIELWPSSIVLEAFQNGGTILSGTPVHGWVAISSQAREKLCVLLPQDSPGASQARPWFTYVAKDVTFFDASEVSEFQRCPGAKAIFDRRFDVDPCELHACRSSRYRVRSCMPQHIGFYSPRLGDVRTRTCLP